MTQDILDLFYELISYETQSDLYSKSYPSTYSQVEFAKLLKDKLLKLGVEDVFIDEYSVIYGKIYNNKKETIGLISHMDTSPSLIGGIKNPRLIKNYDGLDIKLNEDYLMKVSDFSFLKELKGEDIIVTDGTHLLGGDDKAGIAIIFKFIEYYLAHKEEFNYNLAFSFTPDEEIGRGALHFDIKKIGADIAYTIDGGSIYVANYENFNAAHANLTIYGVGVHTGQAKDVMVNSALVANEFINALPKDKVPEKTENREGFIHLDEIKGDVEKTYLHFLLRDHDLKELNKQKELLISIKNKLENKYKKAKFELVIKDDYRNMFDYFKSDMKAINLINKAYLASNTKLTYYPIRGGTDGATITYLGLPCPNLGMGDFSPHGRYEVVSLTQMIKMVEILKELFK